MAKERRTGTLIYRRHEIAPEDFLHFVETDEFGQDWKDLGLDVEIDLWALQVGIMAAPEREPVIKGTGGLRKTRFAPDGWNCGKSGAARVCYAYFKEHWTVLLVMAYEKGRKGTLTRTERAAIRDYLRSVKKYLDNRNY
jgi:hypothetical protein